MSSSPNSELIHRAQTQVQARKPTSDPPPPPPPPQPASPMSHALRNRVPFLLIGIALAALFFHAFPIAESEPESTLPTRRVLLEESTAATKDDAVSRAKSSSSSSVPAGVRGRRKRIVVTGGAGFVGSHLVDRLMERGDSVIVIDNMFTGRKYNLLHHLGNPNFELIRHDVVEPILLEVDQIYHLACPASPVHYKYNPVKTIISFLPHFSLLI